MTKETKNRIMESKAVISKEVVVAIRQCHAANMKTGELAKKFNLSGTQISNIVNNRTYTYL